MSGLRPVVDDEQLAVLRILVDRRRSLGDDHTRMVSQLHRLLLELIPGGAKTTCPPRKPRCYWEKSGHAMRREDPAPRRRGTDRGSAADL